MSGWLVIGIAPKDGQRILGWDGFEMSVTYWNDYHWKQESECESYGYGGGVRHATWSPSHWQPLPEPPK